MSEFMGGFAQGFGQTLSAAVLQKVQNEQRQKREALEAELRSLNEIVNDSSGRFSQAHRDAALYAISQVAQSGKPGKGQATYKKRLDEIMAAPAQGMFGQPTPGQTPAGAPPGDQPPGLGTPPTVPGAGGPPTQPNPMAAGGAALPSTSPVAAGGSAGGAPPLAPAPPPIAAGAAPAPAPQGGATQTPNNLVEGDQPPSEQDLLNYGKSIGTTPPQRTAMPKAPDPYFATKYDADFYKTEAQEHKSSEQRYVDYLERMGTLVSQERRQKQEQNFRRTERVAGEQARAAEGEKNRAARVKAATISASGKTSDADKSTISSDRAALSSYREELERVEREATKPLYEGGLKGNAAEIERRKKAAADIYREVTGKEPPAKPGAAAGGAPAPTPTPAPSGASSVKPAAAGGAKKPVSDQPPGDPAAAAAPDRLAGIRASIEGARRNKIPPEKICASIASSPNLKTPAERAAAKAYAKCP